MSGEIAFSNVLTGRKADPEEVSFATLEALQAALDKPAEPPTERVFHDALGLWLNVVRMSLAGYVDTDPRTVQVPLGQNPATVLMANYLHHGVRVGGKKMSREQAAALAGRDGCGESNLLVKAKVDELNPRLPLSVDRLTLLWNAQRWCALLLGALQRAGVLPEAMRQAGMSEDELATVQRFSGEFEELIELPAFLRDLGLTPWGDTTSDTAAPEQPESSGDSTFDAMVEGANAITSELARRAWADDEPAETEPARAEAA